MTYLGHLRWNRSRRTVGIIIWRNHRRPPLVVLAPRRSHLRTVIGRLSTDQNQGRRSAPAPPEVPLARLFRRSGGDRTCWELWSFVTVLCRSKPVQRRTRQMFQCHTADKAVSMAISRQTEQVSFPAAASSSQVHSPPPPPPPPPPISAGIDCTPTAPPKYAGDALLTTSGQDLHTELVLSRVVGGAVSVKLKSWQNRVILKAAAEQNIERNMLALVKLCTTAGIQPTPFELRCLSTVMRQYAGDSTQMFAHVRCLESKAHVYWSFDLREPFVPREDLSAEQRNLYYFAHGSIHRRLRGTMMHRSFRLWIE